MDLLSVIPCHTAICRVRGRHTKMVMGLQTLALKERLTGFHLFSLEKQGPRGISSESFSAGNVENMKALFS